ncbi:MAG: hypothetical protein GX219_02985 [Tissierellia bacterium]|nr:hypothetical protein [Tissierellia bacterium]
MKNKLIIILLVILLINPASFAAGANQPTESFQRLARLTATGETMYEGKPGDTIAVRFDLNNIGNTEAYNINAIISPAADGSVYPSIRTSKIVPYIIPGMSTQQASFNITIDENAESGLKTLPIKFEYMSAGQQNENPNTVNFDIIVKINKPKVEAGNIFTTDVSFYPSNEVLPGESFVITYKVENVGETTIYDIKTDLTGLKENNVTMTQGLSSQSIVSLAPGESKTISYYLKAEDNAKAGTREFKYSLNFLKDITPQSQTSSVYFSIKQAASMASNLVIENLEYPKGTMGLNQTATVKFSIRNQGMSPARNITIKAEPIDQGGLVSRTVSTHKLNSLLPTEIAYYEFQFFTTEGTMTKNYPIQISVSSMEDPMDPETKQETSQFIGIFVKGKEEGGDDGPKSTPKLIIDKYEFEPQMIEAGSNFNMKLSFYNTNSSKAVKNIKIFLTSEPGATTNAQEASSSSVFTPVGSSNTFYIDSIPPKGRVEKELTMFTIPEALAKTHVITANLEYEDSQANPYTSKELIGVPVVQQAKLSTSELQYQQTGFVGDEIPISTQFYNTGKVTLYNMMVKLEGDFNTRSGEYFVGNFQSGATERFDGSIIADKPGDLTGNLVFTYEDSTGESHRVEQEIKITIEEQQFDPMQQYDEYGYPIEFGPDGMPIMPEKNKGPSMPLIIGGLIAAAVIAGIVIKKRKKKKEEEFLTIDDEDEDLKIDE